LMSVAKASSEPERYTNAFDRPAKPVGLLPDRSLADPPLSYITDILPKPENHKQLPSFFRQEGTQGRADASEFKPGPTPHR
jgi:hypothetical protein